jgi:hypothetical protein
LTLEQSVADRPHLGWRRFDPRVILVLDEEPPATILFTPVADQRFNIRLFLALLQTTILFSLPIDEMSEGVVTQMFVCCLCMTVAISKKE